RPPDTEHLRRRSIVWSEQKLTDAVADARRVARRSVASEADGGRLYPEPRTALEAIIGVRVLECALGEGVEVVRGGRTNRQAARVRPRERDGGEHVELSRRLRLRELGHGPERPSGRRM